MHKNNIKLIAIDIDGTLANYENRVSNENLRAMHIAKKLGINVILATGRSHGYALQIFDQDQIDQYKMDKYDGVFSDGASVYIKGNNFVYRKFSNRDFDTLMFALAHYNLFNYAVFITKDSAYVVVEDPNLPNILVKEHEGIKSSVKYIVTLDRGLEAIVLNNIKDISSIGDILIVHIYREVYEGQEPFNDFFRTLHDELKQNFKVYITEHNDKIVISPLNTSKLVGVELYARLYNININNILSIGNDLNDVQLLSSTGYSVAVKNAIKEVSDIAKCVSTKTNDEHSIADIIYKVISGRL
ncbi:haloacid dehalogenase-like hydrolase, putative [Plasmodium gallinaceum]|uniref:Haloacid dehalogenase-like hydrolase, putative n=1 Tax=Plasmodium gallinaceum TaxID=5849 RepID=A0A1J1GMS5_PLAGA|nr:haloacid dehalogenase-like hydrolase, putative [Plasmodium gallinaceum]CRG93565.1 haloacid dehalogenase-like hydrolase, putative [Plasmodium gallinaceum]